MTTYTLEVTKTIIVSVEADSMKDAHKDIANDDSGFDGAWDRAEATIKTVGVELNGDAPKGPLKGYSVDVARAGIGNRTIEVQATSFAEAEKLALEDAGNYVFTDHSSDYTVESVTAL